MPNAPPMLLALRRGFWHRCPNCGRGALYQGFLKLTDRCSECRESFSHIRADDIPAYFTILIVGHVVVPLVLLGVQLDVPDWLDIMLCLPLTAVLTLVLLPSVKGAVAAHLWRLGMPEGPSKTEFDE